MSHHPILATLIFTSTVICLGLTTLTAEETPVVEAVEITESTSTANQSTSGAPGSVTNVTGGRKVESRTDKPSDIELVEVPSMTTRDLLNKPKNLARWHMGAVVYTAHEGPLSPFNWRDADDGESAGLLLGDDPSAGLELTPDIYKYVIELNDYYLVDRFTFKNFTAVGAIQVYTSNALVRSDSEEWQVVSDPVEFSGEGYVSARFEEVDTKYIMVVFNILETGSIGIFGIYGDLTLAETRLPRTREDAEAVQVQSPDNSETTKFNFGSLHGGSRVTHLSADDTNGAENLIDDDVETYYEFPEDSTENVVIIDMAEQQEVNRVSMLFESGPGIFDFYMTNDLPEDMEVIGDDDSTASTGESLDEETAFQWNPPQFNQSPLRLAAAPGGLGEYLAYLSLFGAPSVMKVVLPESFFENNEYAMEFEVDGSEGRFRADFEVIETRYLIVRFIPAPGGPSGSGLRIFEIGLFGDVPEEKRRLARVPVFEFFENSVNLGGEGDSPTGVGDGDNGVPDGGGAPRPPPPVSPL